MATRSNTVVIAPDGAETILYRHHDGYLDGAGRDLAESMLAADSAPALVSALLAREVHSFLTGHLLGKSYERVNGYAGDAEYVYRVRYGDGEPTVEVCHGFGWDEAEDARGKIRPLSAYVRALNTLTRRQERRWLSRQPEGQAPASPFTYLAAEAA